MTFDRRPSCQDSRESSAAMPVAEARVLLQQRLRVLTETESLALEHALGRVLAEDIISPMDVPRHHNSAMDGFAVRAEDLAVGAGTARLRVVGEAWAGRPWAGVMQSGQAVKIATGAVMPEGADTVVIVEHTRCEGAEVLLGSDTQAGANVRRAGEELCSGEQVLAAGTWLTPAVIALLASLGITQLLLKRSLKVAIFSTGDELVALGKSDKPLQPGQIFDSNRYALSGMLERLGVDVIDLGVIADTSEATREVFKAAAACADVVLCTGGASFSDADHVGRTLEELGDVIFWRLAMRPGRPLACADVDGTLFFALPGNPVAVMVCFYQFVQPALQQIMGRTPSEPLLFQARSVSSLQKKQGRVEFQRGVLTRGEGGHLTVCSTGSQGAARLGSMAQANCFIILPAELLSVEPGDFLDVQPFEGLI